MGKRIQATSPAGTAQASFGQRLTALREAAGFTQVKLAAGLEASQRMVAYYESPTATPTTHLLPAIAQVLEVSIDDLYGRDAPKRRLAKQEGDSWLRRRLLPIDKLETAEKRQVLQLIDAFIERGHLKRKMESRA